MLGKIVGVRALVAVAAGLAALSTPSVADDAATDWPQFRGRGRDGASSETGLLAAWPEGGPGQAWRVPIGEGYSGIAVVGDRLYTMYAGEVPGEAEPRELAAAFDAGTGKEIWRTPIGKKKDTEFGNGPRSTPAVDGDTVYVLGSFGDLAALSAADGAPRWTLNLTEAFGGKAPYFGFSTSALVDGDQVVIEGGGPGGRSYAGLDGKTGEVRWTSGDAGEAPGHGVEAGYNSPLLIDLAGARQYVYILGDRLRSIDPSGKEVWSHPWPEGETHAMPLFIPPDRIFASGVEGVGAQLLKIELEEGKARVQEVWKTPSMRNHFSSSVVHDGHVYGFDNATLKCISVSDARMAWAKRGFGKGSLILADGELFVLSDRGTLALVRATPSGYVEGGRVQALEGRCWTAPTLSAGRLFVRSHAEMVAYDVKG
jgi:outer membrane protein assembly factor BamB